jgi:hypothetical protein
VAARLGLGVACEDAARGALSILDRPREEHAAMHYVDRHGRAMKLPERAADERFTAALLTRSRRWVGLERRSARQAAFAQADGIEGPFRLACADDIATRARTIVDEVLPTPPRPSVAMACMQSLVRLEPGALFLWLYQWQRREFHMERHLDQPVIEELCKDPVLLAELRARLGDDLVLWRSEVWANRPARRVVPVWHHDVYPKLLRGTARRVNVYIALTDVEADNGFEYLRRADVAAHRPAPAKTDPFSGNHFYDIDEKLAERALPVVLRAGEFILFDDTLVHRSIENTSGRVRAALTLRVAAASVEIRSDYSPIFRRVPLGHARVSTRPW